MMADPFADRTVELIIEQEGKEAINRLFSQLRENHDLKDVHFPPPVQRYFNETKHLPDTVNWELVSVGERVFSRYGPQISMCLLCKSLPEAYACAKGAKVLYATGRMTEHNGSLTVFTRRLMETAQFVVNVCSPGGLQPDGKGIVTAQKVRLIHSAIRYYLSKYNWDLRNGKPINQQDMAGTLQSFSTLILQGLQQLNIELSEDEKAGYYHVWHVIGHVMGVHQDVNPASHKEGFELGKVILDDQIAPSKEGVQLTKAVYQFMEHALPGNLLDHVPEAMIRFLAGDRVADVLEVRPYSKLQKLIIPRMLGDVFASESDANDLGHFTAKIAEKLNLHLLQGMLLHFNEHKQVRFYIPPSLKGMWNLN
ncbi:oxygenase MpaB family protein [Parvicella tangerina]|uniref:Rubber oxygenase n=1 Tax=Parvicella tangerina TaxID=2829795 RepID=A0A916JP60_9FLAO|nr:oxygenase MpaB family protein [Parvicella tangerina]CAG5085083.1 Rubber oxygenase [Parvicella tangerina]